MPDLAISCHGLVKRYEDVVAVDGLDLEVRLGECFGLLGPNGAGKTTTVEVLQGLLTPDAGDVQILGMRWKTDERALRERLGTQLQETIFPDKLTVREVVTLFRSLYEHGTTVDEAIDAVALREKQNTWVKKLSGGQRQRLAIAAALVSDPELLFLDEPTAGLDPQSRHQLWDIIASLRERGKTVLLTTHYMDEAERLCDRVAVVDHGKVIALGTPRELIASLGAEHVVEFGVEDGVHLTEDALRELPGVEEVRIENGTTRITVRRVHEAVPALLGLLNDQGASLNQLATHHATLEDVFLHLTGRSLRDA
ncbi:MAG TPA: ABC transporter ATP-binding protein [Gemmatimonadales bacterium]|nr:ABC transporter ATP-binding protein [Gemmatimonadales bacterium]